MSHNNHQRGFGRGPVYRPKPWALIIGLALWVAAAACVVAIWQLVG